VDIQLTDDEKAVLAILQKSEKLLLNDLKTQSGLSNKSGIRPLKD